MYLTDTLLLLVAAVLIGQINAQGAWSECSKPCGYGVQTLKFCAGFYGKCTTYSRACKIKDCGTSGWSACTPSCGKGKQTNRHCASFFGGCKTYTRDCQNPNPCETTEKPPEVPDGPCSKECGGESACSLKTGACKPCNIHPCVSSWGEYSKCTKQCGGGIRFKVDKCVENDINKCVKTYEDCKTQDCPPKKCNLGETHRYASLSECCRNYGTENCGFNYQRSILQKIFGGDVSLEGEWPWVAAQVKKSTNKVDCGGSIIHNKWILSAAHCMMKYEPFAPQDYYIIVGTVKISNPSIGNQRSEIQKFYPHPKHEHPFPTFDIGLIELKEEITFTDQIKPICLPKNERPPDGTKCVVAGFGTTEESNGAPSDILKHVSLSVLPNDVCHNALKGIIVELKDMDDQKNMCIGRLSQEKDTCKGDSGSGVVCQRCSTCSWYVAAVTSMGAGDKVCDKNKPGIYMNVPYFQDWIIQTTKKQPLGGNSVYFCN